jgi:dimethylaniline monooxygenase (N-oxide forming)
MPNWYVLQYLELYAQHYDLERHVRFRHEVLWVERTEDFSRTGEWRVKVRNNENGEEHEEIAQGVLICIGHHVYPNMPELQGLDHFTGDVMHTHSYKYGDVYKHKKVVVVGIGNSGGDAASELAGIADKVYLCTRRGAWINHCVGENGYPSDMLNNSRLDMFLNSIVPYNKQCSYVEEMLNKKIDHDSYNLRPKHRYLAQHPTVNDDLPYRIATGTVTVKGDISRFTERGVVFVGDDTEYEIDSVVLATGYNIRFPFLEEGILEVKKNHVEVYKYMFPLGLDQNTLAVIGLIQPLGCIFPIAEMQGRWFMQLMAGTKRLPSQKDMRRDVENKNKSNAKRYNDSQRHTIQVDYAFFIDELAGLVGCRPNLVWLALTDPRLFWACLTGPLLAYQYRLFGPNRWEGARNAILDMPQRVQAALNTKYKHGNRKRNAGHMSTVVKVSLAGLVVTVAVLKRDQLNDVFQTLMTKCYSY